MSIQSGLNPAGSTPVTEQRPLVLIVDDEFRILHFLQASLKLAGYDVIAAADGEHALKLIEEMKPSAVVVDIMMKPMSGLELISRIRAGSKMPVIAMSAEASAAGDALVRGADQFLTKPFRTEELARHIDDLLGRPPTPA